jgi:hypothetical protein
LQAINKETTMFASIFILILFLPAAVLPLVLDIFVPNADLEEMGVSLENSDDSSPCRDMSLQVSLPLRTIVRHGK